MFYWWSYFQALDSKQVIGWFYLQCVEKPPNHWETILHPSAWIRDPLQPCPCQHLLFIFLIGVKLNLNTVLICIFLMVKDEHFKCIYWTICRSTTQKWPFSASPAMCRLPNSVSRPMSSHAPLCSSVVLRGHPRELTGDSIHSVQLQAQQAR